LNHNRAAERGYFRGRTFAGHAMPPFDTSCALCGFTSLLLCHSGTSGLHSFKEAYIRAPHSILARGLEKSTRARPRRDKKSTLRAGPVVPSRSPCVTGRHEGLSSRRWGCRNPQGAGRPSLISRSQNAWPRGRFTGTSSCL
jgi:hypothetical protein